MIWDIRVSLSIAGYWVVDDVPFEPCDDRGPITRLAFEGDQQALILEGRFGGVWPDLVSPNEAWDNRSRRFELEGYSLEEWVAAKRKQKTPVFSLTHEKIDYFQDESSGSYSSSVFDCYPYRWTPLRKPSTSRHSEP
jgi:hypothetical protein